MGPPPQKYHEGGDEDSSAYHSTFYDPDGHPYTWGKKNPWGPKTDGYSWPYQYPTGSSLPSYASYVSDNRSASAGAPQTPSPTPTLQSQKGLSHGALAAAIVVPILTLLSAIALICLCLRRRKQWQPTEESSVGAAAGIKEKLGSFRRRQDPLPPPVATEPPILTSERNNAYYTGLDTSSMGSRSPSGEYQPGTNYEPPPPYIREPSPPHIDDRARSPFEDPPDNQRFAEDTYHAALGRWGTSHGASNVSMSSTWYSENASVHEAGEARRSTGGAQMVDAMSTTGESSRRGSDPFASPAGSPVSPASIHLNESRRFSSIDEANGR